MTHFNGKKLFDKGYLVIHTGRTGSNLLMDILAQTGVLGVVDFWSGGFFIGLGDGMAKSYDTAFPSYVEKHMTPNGVFGAKAGMEYFGEMKRHIGMEAALEVLNMMTHYVYLERRDKLAQAVSTIFAGSTKRWHNLSKPAGGEFHPLKPYNRQHIQWAMMKIEGENTKAEKFFEYNGIAPLRLYYEDFTQDLEGTCQQVADFLDVKLPDNLQIEPQMLKLDEPEKLEYIERYKRGE